jgi:hypothetical protein
MEYCDLKLCLSAVAISVDLQYEVFLRATDEECGTDEREEVVNSLVTYPKKVFAAEVGKLAAELSALRRNSLDFWHRRLSAVS